MIICDGVGTHLGYHVVKMAIELGIEILLRVKHLSFMLKGEGTVTFKVTAYLFSTCMQAAAAFAFASASTFVVVVAVDVTAYADADVTRSDVDAHLIAFDVAAYDVVDDANDDANMPNAAYHLARVYASVGSASVDAVA